MRRGQGVNEDNEGEKGVCARVSVGCINATHESGHILVSKLMHLCVSGVCPPPGLSVRGDYGVVGGLTMSLARSLSPLTESTVNSGMIVMYQGIDEMAGTHWNPWIHKYGYI